MHALIHLLMVMDVLSILKIEKMTMLQEKITYLVVHLTHVQEK